VLIKALLFLARRRVFMWRW